MSKTIPITRTSTGIGRLTVPALAADGHRIIAAMRDTEERTKRLQPDCNQQCDHLNQE